ncbi:unnamed protein product [Lampetra fluviatilis]
MRGRRGMRGRRRQRSCYLNVADRANGRWFVKPLALLRPATVSALAALSAMPSQHSPAPPTLPTCWLPPPPIYSSFYVHLLCSSSFLLF